MRTRILLGTALLGWYSVAVPVTVSAQAKDAAMRYPSPEAERPISWALLGKYVAEKSPLGDPIAEASKKLAMAGSVMFRPSPAAYLKMTVPDPFENRHLLRMPAVVPEEPMPPLLFPKK